MEQEGVHVQFHEYFYKNEIVMDFTERLKEAVSDSAQALNTFTYDHNYYPNNDDMKTALRNVASSEDFELFKALISQQITHPVFEKRVKQQTAPFQKFFSSEEGKSTSTSKFRAKNQVEWVMGLPLQSKFVCIPNTVPSSNPSRPILYVFRHVALTPKLIDWLSTGIVREVYEENDDIEDSSVIEGRNIDDYIVTLLQSPIDKMKIGKLIESISIPGNYTKFSFSLESHEKYILSNLADNLASICPSNWMSSTIKTLAHFREEHYHPNFKKLFERAGQKFGIHVVDLMDDTRCYLEQYFGKYFKVINLEKNYIISDQKLWLSVLNSFEKGILVIYFKGRVKFSDLFMKWCSEYTAQNCWCLIYFEGVDTTFFLPEQVDRIVSHQEKGNAKSSFANALIEENTYARCSNLLINMENINDYITQYDPNFQDKMANFLKSKEKIAFYVGPPGIGKTKALCDLLQKEHNISMVDGSSPEFVKKSVKEKFFSLGLMSNTSTDNPPIFIVDEFHIMKTSQKKAILSLTQQYNCKLILIANRFHFGDLCEINKYLFNFEAKEHEYLVECGGNLTNILKKVEEAITTTLSYEQNSNLFFNCFLQVCRIYFGEEILSYRYKDKILETYKSRFGKADFYNKIAVSLHEKFPHISLHFMNSFTSYFRVYFKKYQADKKQIESFFKNPKSQSKTLVELLISAAFLHVNSETIVISYPEFISNPKFLPSSYKYHPGCKLYNFFLLLVCSKLGKGVVDQLTSFESAFYSSMIVDIPFRFPQIHLEITEKDKNQAYLLTVRVPDPFDLDTMVTLRQIGYAINKENLVAWKDQFLTNLPLLKKLLNVWPEAIHEMHPQNLKNLLQLADFEIAKIIKDNVEKKSSGDANSEYHIASWVYHCNVPETFANLEKEELYELLGWAAMYAINLNKIAVNTQEFEKSLRNTLLRVTKEQYSLLSIPNQNTDRILKYIRQLWTGTFSKWAIIKQEMGKDYLGWEIALCLASSDTYDRNWHPDIVNLHFFYKKIAPRGTISKLWTRDNPLVDNISRIPIDAIKTTFLANIVEAAAELSGFQLVQILIVDAKDKKLIPDEYASAEVVKHFELCSHQFICKKKPDENKPDKTHIFFWAVIEFYYFKLANPSVKQQYKSRKDMFPGVTKDK